VTDHVHPINPDADIDLADVIPIATTNGKQTAALEPAPRLWLLDAADLLAQPDPGPTPWLVQDLIVDQAIIAFVGRWKTTKSYGLLHICISIATGEPAFGTLEIPNPGPVIFVNEESGRAAMWRRLDALCRGRAIDPDRLRGQLHIAANARVKLDDPGWQTELQALGQDLQPRLFAFDPLARMKAPGRKENVQDDMAPLIEFIRDLREQTKAGAGFVHHTGHIGDQMRGSSDLESAWETRLHWKRDGQSPLVTIETEHREAEASDPIRYRINWDTDTRSMRFDHITEEQNPALPSLRDRILDHLKDAGPSTTDQVAKALESRKAWVVRELNELETLGTTHRAPSGRRDQLGRPITDKAWHLTNQAETGDPHLFPHTGNDQEQPHPAHRGSAPVPVSLETERWEQPPDEPHPDDDIPF
jgi:AAA domain